MNLEGGAALFYWDLEVATFILSVGCEAGWVGAALFYWDLEVATSILSVGCESGGGCTGAALFYWDRLQDYSQKQFIFLR